MGYTLRAPSTPVEEAPVAEEPTKGYTLTPPAPKEADKLELAKDITSPGNRFQRGFMNTFHGAAQALQHALPDEAVKAVNELADKIGGKGSFLGDYLGIKGLAKEDLDKMLADESQQYEEATKLNDPGFDLAGITGEALSPTNLLLAGTGSKVAVAKEGVKKTAAKLGLIGGAAGALQPVTSGDYAGEKAGQIAMGAGAGAVLGPLVAKAADSVGTFVSNRLARGKLATGDVETGVKQALARDGVDITQLPEAIRFELMEDVRKALKEGVELDANQLMRKYDFERFGIQPTQGQLSRNPTQYSAEQNMKGIAGVGDPLANRFSDQQAQIQDQFVRRTMGAKGKYEAGKDLIKDIESKNLEMEDRVRGAYKKYKDSTGKDLDVSLQGMAQDFANINRDFPIPGVVQNRFKEYGLMGGKQVKNMTMDDAEQLIKVINNNYNPMNPAEKRGLDQLRSAVIRSIDESAETTRHPSGLIKSKGLPPAEREFTTKTGDKIKLVFTPLDKERAGKISAYNSKGEEIGIFGGDKTKTDTNIGWILVNEDYRRQGIGTAMSEFAKEHIPELNAASSKFTKQGQAWFDGATKKAAESGSLSAQLAKNARATARERFKIIEENPAFKAAINKKAAPDDFVKKYVIGGKADDIERLTKLVSPETRDQMRVQFMRHLQSKAFGANAAGDGATRQATFNAELQNIGRKKLVAILGEDGADDMMALGRVMSYIQQRPAGATVNESGTAAAVMNILGKVPVAGRAMPFVKEFVSQPLEAAGQRKKIQNALAPKIAGKKAEADPRVMRALSRLVGSTTVLGSVAASDTSK